MSHAPLKIGVLIGSVRPGRFADKVSQWFLSEIGRRDDMETHVIDLSEPVLADELKLTLEQSDGRPHDEDGGAKAAAVLLDQLAWWGLTLREGRAVRPYDG